MACQRCPRLRQELQRTRDNVLLIEGLLEDARRRERTQDTLDRLAMLHKHCRTNYNDMANINFALNHCQNIPRCPGEWNHVPNWNRKQRTVTRVTEHPPQPSDATFEWHVVGVCVPGLACLQVKRRRRHSPWWHLSNGTCHLPLKDDVKQQESVAGRLVSLSSTCLVTNDIPPSSL